MAKLRFLITYKDIQHEVELNNEFTISYSPEDESVFYRDSISDLLAGGQTIKSKEAYKLFKSIELDGKCEYVFFKAQICCNNSFQDLFDGKFSMADCKFNDDLCTIELKVNTDDIFQCIEDGDKNVNILTDTMPVDATISDIPNIEFLLCENNCNVQNNCIGEGVSADKWRVLVSKCEDVLNGTGVGKEIYQNNNFSPSENTTDIDGNFVANYEAESNDLRIYDCANNTNNLIENVLFSPERVYVSGDFVSYFFQNGDVHSYRISTDDLQLIQTGNFIDPVDFDISNQFTIFHDFTDTDMKVYDHIAGTLTFIENTNNVNTVLADGDYAIYRRINPGQTRLQLYQFSTGNLTTIYTDAHIQNIKIFGDNVYWVDTNVGGGDSSAFHYRISTGVTTTINTYPIGSVTEVGAYGDYYVWNTNTDVFYWDSSTGLTTNIVSVGGLDSIVNVQFGCGFIKYVVVGFSSTDSYVYGVSGATTELITNSNITVQTFTETSLIYNGNEFIYGVGINPSFTGKNITAIESDCEFLYYYDQDTNQLIYHISGKENDTKVIIYHRETITLPCRSGAPIEPSGDGWILYQNECDTLGTSTWVRTPQISVDYVEGDCITPPDAVNDWFFIGCGDGIGYWWNLGEPFVYDRFRRLDEVIEKVVSVVCPEITCVVSDFFQINPENTSNINYVTGELSKTMDLLIAQKSDIKFPTSTEEATIGNIEFNELMDYLYCMFQVEWTIDKMGCLRIEHISFYRQTKGLNLLDPKYAKYLEGRNSYSYDNGDQQKSDSFEFMEADNTDFVGFPIEYNLENEQKSPCVGDKDNKCEAGRITTDIDYIRSLPTSKLDDKIEDDGFVIVATEPDGLGGYIICQNTGVLSGDLYNNADLSWANLQDKYWRHERPIEFGFMNGDFTQFITTKRTKLQDEIIIPFCCDDLINFDPEFLVIGPYGEAIIESAEFNSRNDTLKLELRYPC